MMLEQVKVKPNKTLVGLLEMLLDKARSGELQFFSFAGEKSSGSDLTGYAFTNGRRTCNTTQMVGALEAVKIDCIGWGRENRQEATDLD